MMTTRPAFDRVEFDSVWPENPTLEDEDSPDFLTKLGINETIIACAEAISAVYKKYNDVTFSYEIALISRCIDFLQRQANLSDPNMIRAFALFFQTTIKKYAVRYNDDGNEYTNASLGEIDTELYSSTNNDVQKLILIITAFYTRDCLISGKNLKNPVNHIHDENHTIEYQSDKILRNVFQCMQNMVMTDDSVQGIIATYIARADIHTRGSTIGKGNTFGSFYDELDDDSALSSFCDDYENELTLDKKLVMGNRRLSSCRPILIDLMLGIFNISLYAAYTTAKRQKVRIFLASDRSKIIFGPNDDGTYGLGLCESDVAIISLGLHPNSVQSNLTSMGPNRRPPEHMQLLDKGITAVLEPLDRVPIKVINNGVEEDATFHWRESDFFQRLYYLRVNGIIQEEGDYTYELLMRAKAKLLEAEGDLEKVRRETKEAKMDLKEMRKVLVAVKATSTYDANMKLSRECQDRKMAETEKKRRKMSEDATAELDNYFTK